jgi:hypothetical protein
MKPWRKLVTRLQGGRPADRLVDGSVNLAVVTLDALRWDTAQAAATPNLDRLFAQTGARWHKVYAHGTYTLPSHVALFQSGALPTNEFDPVPAFYRRADKDEERLFSILLPWDRERRALYNLPSAPNLVQAFAARGYRTVGLGGVHWFDTSLETSGSVWRQYFQEFHYRPEFSESDPDGLEHQLELCRSLELAASAPLFFFLNIAACHLPCRGERSPAGQAKALEWVDQRLPAVWELLPRPCHVLLWSDHGTLLGEELNGQPRWGHGFHHPLVVTVPATDFLLA